MILKVKDENGQFKEVVLKGLKGDKGDRGEDGTVLQQKEIDDIKSSLDNIAYNVMNFFQVPENDWTMAIQRAIDKSIVDGNRKVYVPSGRYGINKPIYCNTPIEFYGSGDSTIFYPTRSFIEHEDIINSNINSEHGAMFVFMKDVNSNILSVEKTLDNFNIHDFQIKGDKRKYVVDGIHLEYLDHSYFNNLKIEELKGSAIKARHIRENNFSNINTRYCGKTHNVGENEYTQGHPTIEIKPTDNDTSNINHWVSCNFMCSYYTSLRVNRSHNIFTDIYCHSIGTFIENQDHIEYGLPPAPIINGEKADYDVIQVINTYDSKKISNYFVNCSAIWGGVNHSQIYVENSIVYLNNFVGSTHWNKVNDNSVGGYGIGAKNSLIFGDLLNIENNNIMFKDFGGSTFTLGNFGTLNPTYLDNTFNEKDWSLGGIQQHINSNLINLFKGLPVNLITDGKFINDKIYHTNFKKSDNTLLSYIASLSSGRSILGVKNGMLLLEKHNNTNTDVWNGMIYHDNDGFIKAKDNVGTVTLTKTQMFQERSSLPSADASNRGRTFLLQRSGQNDELYICLMKSDGTYMWKKIAEPI